MTLTMEFDIDPAISMLDFMSLYPHYMYKFNSDLVSKGKDYELVSVKSKNGATVFCFSNYDTTKEMICFYSQMFNEKIILSII